MEPYKRFAKDVSWVGMINIALLLRGILIIPIISKAMGSLGYGLWTQVMITIGLIVPLTMLGLNTSLTRFLPGEKKEDVKKGFFSSFIITLLFSAIVAIIVFIFSSDISSIILKDVSFAPLIKMVSIIIIIWSLQGLMFEYFRSTKQVNKYGIIYSLEMLTELLMVFLMVSYGIYYIVLSILLTRLVFFAISLTTIIKQIGFFCFDIKTVKEYLKFGLPLLPKEFFTWIINTGDRYIIVLLMTTSAVGIYSASYSLAGIIAIASMPIIIMLLPTISRSLKNNKSREIENYIKYSVKYFLLLAIPLFIILTTMSSPILKLFTTTEFLEYGIIIIPMLGLSMIMSGISGIFGQLILLDKKPGLYSIIAAVAATANVIANLFLIKMFGIVGAAISTLITFSILLVLTIYFVKKTREVIIPYKSIIKFTVSTAIISAIILYFDPVRISHMILTILVVSPIYLALLFAFRTFEKKEIEFIKLLMNPRSRTKVHNKL